MTIKVKISNLSTIFKSVTIQTYLNMEKKILLFATHAKDVW